MPAEGSQQLSLPLEIGTEGWLVKGMNHLQLFSVLSEFVRDAAAEFVLDALSQRVQESLPVAPIVAEDPLYEVDDLVQLLVLVLERQEHQVVRNGQLYWAASRGDHFMSCWLVVVVSAGLDHGPENEGQGQRIHATLEADVPGCVRHRCLLHIAS